MVRKDTAEVFLDRNFLLTIIGNRIVAVGYDKD